MNPVIRAVEPAACPSFTRGVYAYDFGDTAGITPLLKMHTLGHEFIPDPIHAGGLRYHGMSPLLSHIYELGLIEAVAKPQSECFAAGLRFARTEGIVPAPEPTHALAACIEEALRCKETGEEKVILTALCGHGLLDLPAYGDYLAGELNDFELPERQLEEALAGLPAGCVDPDLGCARAPRVSASGRDRRGQPPRPRRAARGAGLPDVHRGPGPAADLLAGRYPGARDPLNTERASVMALFRSRDDTMLVSLTRAIRLTLPADPGPDRMLDARPAVSPRGQAAPEEPRHDLRGRRPLLPAPGDRHQPGDR